MTYEQLAADLKKACEKAPRGERVPTIHVFGVRYAAQLKGMNCKKIAVLAGIPESYGTEISKGVKLASYVQLRPGV